MSAVKEENRKQMEAMAAELCKEYIAKDDDLANKNDMTALFRIGYGLYVVTSNDGKKDNGLIVNTVTQLTDSSLSVLQLTSIRRIIPIMLSNRQVC